MEKLIEIVDDLSGFVWGPWCLIPLLFATGIYLTALLGGLQLRKLWHALYLAFVVRREPDGEARGDISHFQALMTALAATVGTGNIVGVATAMAFGGPGALFWMWMTAVFGMATKYSEALLSVKYRITSADGTQSGGPMYYLSRGIGWRPMGTVPLGRILGFLFAMFAAVAAFGIGNLVQANSVATALEGAFAVPRAISGAAMTLLAAIVVLGGIRSIGRFTSFFVPLMVVVYMAGCAVVIVIHLDRVPEALALVFRGAFSGTAAAGGFAGAAVARAVRFGVARGIFSNESGLGSAGMAAAAARTSEPVRQSLVSMTQTFIDTLVVCTMTGLVILVTDGWSTGEDAARMTQLSFKRGLPGTWGDATVAASLAMFAFSTILGWCYYGERSIEYVLDHRAIRPYRVLFVAAVFLGAVTELKLVWGVADILNGLMAIPNLVGLCLLSGVVRRETREYFRKG